MLIYFKINAYYILNSRYKLFVFVVFMFCYENHFIQEQYYLILLTVSSLKH